MAAEETARIEAEQLAAEQAERLEAERLEAERLEAERLEAEEAARPEVERLEAEHLESERSAADDAAREAQRLAVQEAAEEGALAAAEQEARRAAELEEANRIAAVNQMMAAHAAYVPHSDQPSGASADHDAAYDPPASDPGHLASAGALLSEFSRTGATTLASAEPQSAPEPEEEHDGPHPVVQRDLADTASLLRELSSLGFEDEPPTPAGPRPPHGAGASAPRPVTAVSPQKKKRGLFGR